MQREKQIQFIKFNYMRAGLGNNLLRLIDLITIYKDNIKIKINTNNIKISRFCKPNILGSKGKENRKNLLLSETLFRKEKIDLDLYFNTVKTHTTKEDILGIHFRGRDFVKWKKHSIIPPSFFLDSLEQFNNYSKIYVVTDDPTHNNIKELMSSNIFIGKSVFLFSNSEYSDFAILSRTNKIIASPSTFSLCASMFGPKDIVYPKKYATLEQNSPFWTNLINGEKPNYTNIFLK